MSCGPLHGIRVVEVSHMYAGPYCGQWLGDMGADVIKVESTDKGDRQRYGPALPFFMKEGKASYTFLSLNRNKRSIAVDMGSEAGRLVVQRLAKWTDVFTHNLHQRTAKKLGLAYEDLSKANPGLVYASVSGFGDKGPYADLPGQDLQMQAMAGLMSITGYPDKISVPVGAPIADAVAGILTAFGILAALYARKETGEGQEVKASLFASLLGLIPHEVAIYFGTKRLFPKSEEGSTYSASPFGTWRTKDGREMAISGWRDEPYAQFCVAIDRSELAADPRFAKFEQRWENRDELKAIVQEVLLEKTLDEWIPILRANGQWVVPVRNMEEVCTGDAHLQDNDLLVELEHPVMGNTTLLGAPIKLTKTPLTARRHPPLHGEDTKEILSELGYSEVEIEELFQTSVVK